MNPTESQRGAVAGCRKTLVRASDFSAGKRSRELERARRGVTTRVPRYAYLLGVTRRPSGACSAST